MRTRFKLAAAALVAASFTAHAQSWEPTKNVEFIIPAGTGGGADQMARAIQGIVAKHNLMKQSILPINKAGGAGAEGFLDVKNASGDPHKIIITLSNLFTTPLATGVPFNWKDLTPVQMLALDNFVLWVNAKTPYKTPKEYIEAAKKAGPGKMKMGGTGAKQEDQIITAAIEQKTGAKFTYIPFKGGGAVATQLVGETRRLDGQQSDRGGRAVARRQAASTVRVRREAPALQGEGDRQDMSWADIPMCKEAGARRRLPDAARHLHAAGCEAGACPVLRGSLQEGDGHARVEEADGGGGFQYHRARRQAVRRLGGERRAASSGAHEERRLPRRQLMR